MPASPRHRLTLALFGACLVVVAGMLLSQRDQGARPPEPAPLVQGTITPMQAATRAILLIWSYAGV